jgi:aspartate aminotransferase-like enzyme
MILKPVNLSTGPVGITKEVQEALFQVPLSHRSSEFKELFHATTRLLCKEFNVKETFLLSGSGSLANEAMLQEIKELNGQGLILSNGEFGNRLVCQAQSVGLTYNTCVINWGCTFSLETIKALCMQYNCAWILFCHCETSTGVTNDMQRIAAIAMELGIKIFVDCMSSTGTQPLDLSIVSMASASSGKGLASIPGIAIVFSNLQTKPKKHAPVYLDLHHYHSKKGLPFTISSNLVKALNISIKQKLCIQQFELAVRFREKIYNILNTQKLIPFNHSSSSVFTIIDESNSIQKALQSKVIVSSDSDYLKQRNWWQMATFGYYTEEEVNFSIRLLEEAVLENVFNC